MPLRETSCSLAWCTAFHRACWRGVACLGGGVYEVGPFSSSTCWSAGAPNAARAVQDLEHHGGLSRLTRAGYDLDEPPGLGRALQQGIGVWAVPEGCLWVVKHDGLRTSGEALAVIVGMESKLHCFVLDLPHSDGCFFNAYPAETTETFLAVYHKASSTTLEGV